MDVIDELFEEPVVTYPGSKQPIKDNGRTTEQVSPTRAIDLFDPENWGFEPLTKFVGGKEVKLYTFGALCAALDRPQITVRLWESKRYLPPAPFRADHVPGKGGTAGRRYYPLEAITACLEEFHKRGLLGATRIEWLSEHADLPGAIAARWSQIIEDFNAATDGE